MAGFEQYNMQVDIAQEDPYGYKITYNENSVITVLQLSLVFLPTDNYIITLLTEKDDLNMGNKGLYVQVQPYLNEEKERPVGLLIRDSGQSEYTFKYSNIDTYTLSAQIIQETLMQ